MEDIVRLKQPGSGTVVDRKSEFIGCAFPIESEEEAREIIASVKKKHPDARHNVFAYSLNGGSIKRYSDDGEPSGTAGLPTLEVLTRAGITDTVLVTTRYFGGTLLGTGGLVRAYSHAASLAVAAGGVVWMRVCTQAVLLCEYHQYSGIARILPNYQATIDDTVYGQDVEVQFHLPPEQFEGLCRALADATGGTVEPEITGSAYFASDSAE